MQINYSVGEQFAVSSSSELIAEHFGFKHSEECLYIRRKSNVSQALPNDITLYKEVRLLLPNHYYDAMKRVSRRFDVKQYCINTLSIAEAAKQTIKLIDNITAEYVKKFDIICPLTSGRDSRVVLAFLRKHINNLICYTLKHQRHRGDEPDLVIPGVITNSINLPYVQINDMEVPIKINRLFDNSMGKGLYSKYTLMLAYTIKNYFNGKAIINGDIIGQIGKGSLHRNLPEKWANPSYFMCKLHNYSKQAKTEIKRWYKSTLENEGHISSYDLFSWEIRLGRWVTQTNYIYDILGIPNLNIFNCRNIIYAWVQTDRGRRQHSELHKEILRMIDPELLGYPFEPERNVFFRLAKLNACTFYISSYIKHWVGKILHVLHTG